LERAAAHAESAASPDASEAVAAMESTNVWPDEAAEAAFFAESRVRGEPADPVAAVAITAAGETEPRGLPPLDELVKRIPPEVRETLDELFRVKFTGVKRVPQNALKG
jgi:hypothetical protein